jgi:hypothetical protein
MLVVQRGRFVLLALVALLVGGCAAVPGIHRDSFTVPQTVAIVEAPPMRSTAIVGMFLAGHRGHFNRAYDFAFLPEAPNTGVLTGPFEPDAKAANGRIAAATIQGAMLGHIAAPKQPGVSSMHGAAVGGIVGGIIQASAESTAKKSQTYHEDVLQQVPDLDLQSDVVKALRAGLESKGIQTSIEEGGKKTYPRLRWPAKEIDGRVYETATDVNAPAVDADILMQVSAFASWQAAGPLNSYARMVSMEVVLYNGRTKQFLGRQTLIFDAPIAGAAYNTYDGLLADSPKATGLLRSALLSLVPQVVNIVSKQEPKPKG